MEKSSLVKNSGAIPLITAIVSSPRQCYAFGISSRLTDNRPVDGQDRDRNGPGRVTCGGGSLEAASARGVDMDVV